MKLTGSNGSHTFYENGGIIVNIILDQIHFPQPLLSNIIWLGILDKEVYLFISCIIYQLYCTISYFMHILFNIYYFITHSHNDCFGDAIHLKLFYLTKYVIF